ncbi:ADP-ribosylation factor-like protein 2-binding protein isoform X1 [Theropithecus gelada]|nr:ADP-ribosylation factor-like protein 2-binding protein isoform X1 [Theropithecus gelada]
MDALEEESFALSFSSASDAEFDAVVGYLEDIIMDDEFQLLQRNFMDKYYLEFEDTEENKLTYTPIFNEYISLVEKYIEEQLLQRIPGFNMAAFTTTLQHHKDEVAGDIFDMLLTFTDFLAFKEMFLDYRALPRTICGTRSYLQPMNGIILDVTSPIGPAHDGRTHLGKTDSVM